MKQLLIARNSGAPDYEKKKTEKGKRKIKIEKLINKNTLKENKRRLLK